MFVLSKFYTSVFPVLENEVSLVIEYSEFFLFVQL